MKTKNEKLEPNRVCRDTEAKGPPTAGVKETNVFTKQIELNTKVLKVKSECCI